MSDPLFIKAKAERSYDYRENLGAGIFTIPALSAIPCIDHGFSARSGGVSTGPFESMNLSFTRETEQANVAENYRRFCKAAGIPVESMVLDHYEHGTTVLKVDRADRGKGYDKPPLPLCDGLVTDDPAVTLFTGHADCMAFYAVDPVRKCIGLAHAGWRGALNRIGKNLIEQMVLHYSADPARIIAAVGPSICPSCFEVGPEVIEMFSAAYPGLDLYTVHPVTGKTHIDLWSVAETQFKEAGVKSDNIYLSGVCTVEDDRLFSYRGAKGPTGGMAAYLRLIGC